MSTEPESFPAITEVDVRGTAMRLSTPTRVLALCARMNYETANLDFIDQIPAGDVLYDLGACEGRFALYAALRGAEVYAFEPERLNFEHMQANLALNPAAEGRLHPLKLAVGDHDHQTTIKIGSPWAGAAKRVLADVPSRADLGFTFVAEEAVEVVALDGLVASGKLPPPAWLKIDVDGSEAPFLAGAAATLASPGLKGLIFELLKADPSYPGIVEQLAARGWRAASEQAVETAVLDGLCNIVFTRG